MKPLYKNEKNPVKILYLQSTSEVGGSDVSLLRTVEVLDKTRFEPHVILPHTGPLVEVLRKAGCKIHFLPSMRKLTSRKGEWYLVFYMIGYIPAVFQIVRLIRREKISIVHTNTLHNLYGFLAAKFAGVPHIWHVREIALQSKVFRMAELFLAIHFTDRVVVTSDAVAEMFAGTKGKFPPHLRKISNGIDVGQYHPKNDGASIFEDLRIHPHAPLVGLICRLDEWKGVDTFLHAVAACRREYPKVRYLVVGGAIEGQRDYAEKMVRLADTLCLKDIVYFTGWRYRPEDMPKVHAALNVLVVASSSPEPFGLVLLEAMATGKPVVATNHGGPKEICVDGRTAILVPPRDPQKMASAIIGLLQDPKKASAMGMAGRRRVEELFDHSAYIRKLESLYSEVLAGTESA